jgi:hypothetical protein
MKEIYLKSILIFYLKIQEESTFKLIEKNGYKVIKRSHLLNVIKKYKNISSFCGLNFFELIFAK